MRNENGGLKVNSKDPGWRRKDERVVQDELKGGVTSNDFFSFSFPIRFSLKAIDRKPASYKNLVNNSIPVNIVNEHNLNSSL